MKCEICAQTCPVKCIHVIESASNIEDDVTFHLKDVKVPHRKLRMESIHVNPDTCDSCANCVKFCPTGAITVNEGEIAQIDPNMCVGCGSCVNLCPQDSINLVRELGPVIKTKELLVDEDICVQCQVCEENCPVDAIKLDGDRVVLDQEKCILCEVCSTKCPVGALKLEMV
ncbi:MAG: 4Fe-4S binding protein [Methanobacteriaceae archaeon]|nr:4Fe-4S binding protein [Methanobacteriaceae archaeon]MDI6882655.1 4Fe-4S binding protein [Methanothermobacter sp.]